MRLTFYILFVSLYGCGGTTMPVETYEEYRTQQIEARDSLLVLYTVREWGKRNWDTWGVRSDMYKLTTEEVNYFIGGMFYSPDRKKMLVWIGTKEPNAETWEKYSKDLESNKICPGGADTIFSMSALIGIRDSVNQVWELYSFDQQQAVCFHRKEGVINVMGQYYFEKMKTHSMYTMIQSGKQKGNLISQPFGYNLQDKYFWDKCWLWQKDTVGSYGLYPFQIKGYSCDKKNFQDIIETYPDQKEDETNGQYLARQGRIIHKPLREKLKDCAEPYCPPKVDCPEEILNLYK